MRFLVIMIALMSNIALAEIAVDIPRLAGLSPSSAAEMLGDPSECGEAKEGVKCVYPGGVEVVFIDDKADWITVSEMGGERFAQSAMKSLGLEPTRPNVKTKYVMRWENFENILEVSLFPVGGNVDYAYIKVKTE